MKVADIDDGDGDGEGLCVLLTRHIQIHFHETFVDVIQIIAMEAPHSAQLTYKGLQRQHIIYCYIC